MARPEGIAVRFQEAIDFLARRLEIGAQAWLGLVREMDEAAADRSAGMSDALVTDILREVMRAMDEGSDIRVFLGGWDEVTRRHGWEDDSGGRRARMAFRMMAAQARAAGRWRQIQRLKHIRPYLRYVHVDPELTQPGSRHEHAAWHGLILSVDDPWWLTHYPPNGWNCRCQVMSLSDRDLVRWGWTVSEAAPESRTVIRFHRGRPVETPAGIDPGFAFNAGVVGMRLPEAA